MLLALRRYAGSEPLARNVTTTLSGAELAALICAPFPPKRPGGSELIARAVVAAAVLREIGHDGPLGWVATALTDDCTPATLRLPCRTRGRGDYRRDGTTVTLHRVEGDRDPVVALAVLAAAARLVGSPTLFGVGPGPSRAVGRVGTNIAVQLSAGARRAGLSAPVWTLSPEDWSRYLDHLDPAFLLGLRTRMFCAIAATTGARHSDLAAVRLPVRPLRNGRSAIRVPRGKTDQRGEGRDLFVDHTTGHPPTCPGCLLDRWVVEARLTDGDHLLASIGSNGRATGHRAVESQENSMAIRRLASGAQLDLEHRKLGTHSLRKTCAVLLALAGDDVQQIAAHTGQSESVVRRHYMRPEDPFDVTAQIT